MDKLLTISRLCLFWLFVNYSQGIAENEKWLSFNENEYMFSTTAKQWTQASETCGQYEAKLLVITSEAENSFVTPLARGRSRWLGLRKSNNLCTCENTNVTVCESCRNSLSWYDGTPMMYSNWNVGRPGAHHDCNVLTEAGSWGRATCTDYHYFACQRERRLRFGRSEYIFGTSLDGSSWPEARIKCENIGAHLAVITSDEEGRHLRNLGVWIGLIQDSECGCSGVPDSACAECRDSWVWNDGTPMQYQAWADDQPSLASNRCGYLNNMGSWTSLQCHHKRYNYLCERELKSHCLSEPCQNGGLCQEDENTYTCYCIQPFTGRHCEELSLPSSQENDTICSSNPCINGGLCYLKGESYACLCSGCYGGANCDENLENLENLETVINESEESNDIGWIIGMSVLAVLFSIVSTVAIVFVILFCRAQRELIKDSKKEHENKGYELSATSTAMQGERTSYEELSPNLRRL